MSSRSKNSIAGYAGILSLLLGAGCSGDGGLEVLGETAVNTARAWCAGTSTCTVKCTDEERADRRNGMCRPAP